MKYSPENTIEVTVGKLYTRPSEVDTNIALVVPMGKLKPRRLQVAKEEADREKTIKKACDGVQQGRFPPVQKAAEAYGVHYSTVRWRLKGAKPSEVSTCASTAINTRRRVWIPTSGKPCKGSNCLIEASRAWFRGGNYRGICDPGVIQRHLPRSSRYGRNIRSPRGICTIWMERVSTEGIGRAKVIYQRRERGMTGKMATDGRRELVTAVETISGDGAVLSPLII